MLVNFSVNNWKVVDLVKNVARQSGGQLLKLCNLQILLGLF